MLPDRKLADFIVDLASKLQAKEIISLEGLAGNNTNDFRTFSFARDKKKESRIRKFLISFKVVAPAMMRGIDIDLPKVKDAPTLKQERPIAITIPASSVPTNAPTPHRMNAMNPCAAPRIRSLASSSTYSCPAMNRKS